MSGRIARTKREKISGIYVSEDTFDGPIENIIERLQELLVDAEVAGYRDPEIHHETEYGYYGDSDYLNWFVTGERDLTEKELAKNAADRKKAREAKKRKKEQTVKDELAELERLQAKYGPGPTTV